MNDKTRKLLEPVKKFVLKYKVQVILVGIFVVSSCTAMCATCN